MAPDLSDVLERVHDRDSFLAFVNLLRLDLVDENIRESSPHGPEANRWQNGSIEAFLEAMLAWGSSYPIGEEPTWQNFARLLFAGRSYE